LHHRPATLALPQVQILLAKAARLVPPLHADGRALYAASTAQQASMIKG